jgi:ABC-type Zn uptake system ZnuABC Zn-binding protein ZnuA
MDPESAKQYVRTIEEQLQKLDSAGQEMYTTNTNNYLDTISSIQGDALRTIGSVPVEDRKLVTAHSAFGHFASAFGIEIVAVVVHGPGQEPSPEDVANLSRAIKDQDVPAVFREPQLDSEGRVLEQAAKDAGVRICTLYSDSLDDRVTSYIEMMRFNADEIARCLGGDSGG